MIRVLVVDDHPVVRRGLRDLLSGEPDIDVVATAEDAGAALAAVRDHRPSVVLMDISMPGEDGVSATRTLLGEFGDVAVVILTTFAEQDKILAALDAGAVGYLLKDAEPDELVRGVRAAAAGESPISPRAARALLAARQSRPADPLTAREREVLALVAGGLANKQIARHLAISEKTVKAHLTRIFTAIGVTDRTQAALWAERNGIGRQT